MTMAKTVKLTKMASNDYPHPTVSGSEGPIHIKGCASVQVGKRKRKGGRGGIKGRRKKEKKKSISKIKNCRNVGMNDGS
jgi:hypothetical protein